ncbi:MAG: AAA family ATPase [Bacteroidota bacterium]
MKSPFKFLDAYTREDHDQFFGREEETAQLYELVNQNRLVLLYGPSGTGKTSLIQCGLGNRFDATDWLPLFIRRGDHLPRSMQRSIEQKVGESLEEAFWEAESGTNPLIELIEELFAEYLRPVYLIFDQFEELFVLGSPAEREIFVQAMADIYAAKLPCRLLFVMREEYLAHLYDFEKQIPSLFKRRLRVEAMSAQQAAGVVAQSCARFNIRLENPAQNPQDIISKISAGRSGVALPYLQVYLDRLYREDFARTYPQGLTAAQNAWPELEFTSAEIESFGEIGDVLKAFLAEQSQQIQSELSRQDSKLPERAVRKVLNSFASLQGTKIPLSRSDLSFKFLTEEQLDTILSRLEQARILREEEGRYELAHDTLAGEVAEQRSGQEQALLEIVELVKNRSQAFERTSTYLESRELELIANYETALQEEQKLSPTEWDFIKASTDEARRKRQRSRLITTAVISVLSIFLALAAWQWWEAGQSADEAARKAREAQEAQSKAEAANLATQGALLNFFNKDMELLRTDSLDAVKAVESGIRIELPAEMMKRRYDALGAIKSKQAALQIKIDSIGSLIDEN